MTVSKSKKKAMEATMDQKRLRLRDWLEVKINDPAYPGLEWVSKREKIFRIPWKHGARHGWREDQDARLFREWSEHTGASPRDVKQHKANFRCALNSLRDVFQVHNLNKQKGDDAYRVYQMKPKLSTKRSNKWIKVRKQQKRSSYEVCKEERPTSTPSRDFPMEHHNCGGSMTSLSYGVHHPHCLHFGKPLTAHVQEQSPNSFLHHRTAAHPRHQAFGATTFDLKAQPDFLRQSTADAADGAIMQTQSSSNHSGNSSRDLNSDYFNSNYVVASPRVQSASPYLPDQLPASYQSELNLQEHSWASVNEQGTIADALGEAKAVVDGVIVSSAMDSPFQSYQCITSSPDWSQTSIGSPSAFHSPSSYTSLDYSYGFMCDEDAGKNAFQDHNSGICANAFEPLTTTTGQTSPRENLTPNDMNRSDDGGILIGCNPGPPLGSELNFRQHKQSDEQPTCNNAIKSIDSGWRGPMSTYENGHPAIFNSSVELNVAEMQCEADGYQRSHNVPERADYNVKVWSSLETISSNSRCSSGRSTTELCFDSHMQLHCDDDDYFHTGVENNVLHADASKQQDNNHMPLPSASTLLSPWTVETYGREYANAPLIMPQC